MRDRPTVWIKPREEVVARNANIAGALHGIEDARLERRQPHAGAYGPDRLMAHRTKNRRHGVSRGNRRYAPARLCAAALCPASCPPMRKPAPARDTARRDRS